MGILDEAIREHLELKRQHGAGDSELRELEGEAFGPSARPGAPAGEAAVADLPAVDDEAAAAKTELLAGLQEAPPEPAEAAPESPPDVEEPAMEHPVETRPDDAGEDAGTVAVETEEHPPPEPVEEPKAASEAPEAAEPEETSVTDQPTELHDFGEQAPAEEPAVEEPGEPVEDEFFSEQSLSDELDQALDAPETEGAPEPAEGAPEAAEAPEATEEPTEPPEEGEAIPPHEPDDHFDGEEEGDGGDEGDGEDVLEETPEFLQDTPEHDRLWFEQRPPKDFDFDD
jgi:hypothetical protein